jgi:putative MATE family efflux protein
MKNIKENKMGVMPIGRLILTMSVPIMISMLIQALYNIVDSMYVAMISEEALTAVSIAFPYQNLMIAVATGTGVGVNSLLSRNLGERDFTGANKTANISLTIALIISALFALLGFVIIKPFLSFQTENPVIFSEAKSYLLIVSTFSFGLFGQIATERLLQATGKTVYSMITQALGAIINIILDPIMIFSFKMGIAGAAYATVIAQIIATLTGILLNIHINKELTLSVKLMKIDFDIVKKIYVVGIPSIVMGSIGSVMTFCINKILVSFTETAVAVFGAYFKLQSFIFMPVFGLNNGIVPIMAYNLGAKKPDRIKKTIKLSMIYATSFMLLGFIVFQTIPHVLLGNLFNASAKMLSIGIPALKIISIAFIFAGICIVTISVFQAVGKGMYSLYVSVARQLVVLIPCAYLLSLTGSLNLIWLAFPIAEIVSIAVCMIYLKRVYKKIFTN